MDPVEGYQHLAVMENRLELWNHGGNPLLTDTALPLMLHLLTLVAENLVGKMCIPWDLFKAVTHVYIEDNSSVTEAQYELIRQWAMAPSQSSQDISKLFLSIMPANSPDIGFHRWASHQLKLHRVILCLHL